jgi:hypothetical protein
MTGTDAKPFILDAETLAETLGDGGDRNLAENDSVDFAPKPMTAWVILESPDGETWQVAARVDAPSRVKSDSVLRAHVTELPQQNVSDQRQFMALPARGWRPRRLKERLAVPPPPAFEDA